MMSYVCKIQEIIVIENKKEKINQMNNDLIKNKGQETENEVVPMDFKLNLFNLLMEMEFYKQKNIKIEFDEELSLINELQIDSIQALEYLIAIEMNLGIVIDYSDIDINIFGSFNKFSEYFYAKALN